MGTKLEVKPWNFSLTIFTLSNKLKAYLLLQELRFSYPLGSKTSLNSLRLKKMHCHPAKTWMFLLKKKKSTFCRSSYTWQVSAFIWQQQKIKLRACPHRDTYATFTQPKRQHGARKHPNIFYNFFPRPLSCLSLSLSAASSSSSEAADLL